jgi:hypothetical protein
LKVFERGHPRYHLYNYSSQNADNCLTTSVLETNVELQQHYPNVFFRCPYLLCKTALSCTPVRVHWPCAHCGKSGTPAWCRHCGPGPCGAGPQVRHARRPVRHPDLGHGCDALPIGAGRHPHATPTLGYLLVLRGASRQVVDGGEGPAKAAAASEGGGGLMVLSAIWPRTGSQVWELRLQSLLQGEVQGRRDRQLRQRRQDVREAVQAREEFPLAWGSARSRGKRRSPSTSGPGPRPRV